MIVRELVTRLRYSVDNRGMQEYENQLNALHHFAVQVGASIASALSGVGIARISDEWKGVNNQLSAILETQAQVAEAEEEIYRVAQASRSGYEATGELFASIQRGAHLYNLEAKDSIRLTETINKLMSMGRGGEGAMAALIQFTQAISSGELRGEELRSVMEQSAPLMIAIADAMGTTQDKLLKMGEAGELKVGAILRGLLKQSEEVDARFGKMQWTFAQGWTVSRNMLGEFVSDMDKLYGVSNWLIQKIMISTDRLIASLRGMIQWGQEAFSWLAWQLGGTEEAVNAVKLSLMALAGPAVLRALRGLTGWVWRAFLPFTLMVAAIGVILLGLDDILAWANGNQSLFEGLVGPFSEWKDEIEAVQQALSGLQPKLDGAAEAMGRLVDKLGELVDMRAVTAEFSNLAIWMLDTILTKSAGVADGLGKVLDAFLAISNGDWMKAAGILKDGAVSMLATQAQALTAPARAIFDQATGFVRGNADRQDPSAWIAGRYGIGGPSYGDVTVTNYVQTASGSPSQVMAGVERGNNQAFGKAGIPYRTLGTVERAP